MKRLLLFGSVLLTLGLAVAATSPARAPDPATTPGFDPDDDERAIVALLERQMRAFAARDYETEKAIWANEPYVMRVGTSGQRDVGWEKIGASYETVFAENPEPFENLNFSHLDIHVRVTGDAAWAVYDQILEFDDDGEPAAFESREVRFLERIDGSWRIVFQSTTSIEVEDDDI